MATTSATFSSATITKASVSGITRASSQRKRSVVHVCGLNSFGGLKAHNSVAALGLPVCTEQSLANVVSSLKKTGQKRGGGGGALTSTCNAGAEILQIVLVMNGLTLVGVAMGFLLLRIEAFVEEGAID